MNNEIEHSIVKKYRKSIWSKCIEAINEFDMIKENDRIAVCISGGKDSFLLAKCLQELQKHGKIRFYLEYIVMNPGYKQKNIDLIKQNAQKLNIPIHIFEANIFNYVTTIDKGSPCYICARMRRGYLYNEAQKLGCNKIALGHHFDDVLETILLNILYSGEFKTMMPKLHSQNYEGMELIRPLYYVKENNIIKWQETNELKFLNCACKLTEDIKKDNNLSKRKEMKDLINQLRAKSCYIEKNIYKSTTNVNLNAILGYQIGNDKKNFLDDY